MELAKWAECCKRYESLWRTARLSDETMHAWFEEFGVWADYALALRSLNRLSTEAERPPSLATWRELHGVMIRERSASQRREQGEPVPDGPGSPGWERRRRLGEEWMHVNDCLHDDDLAAMFGALQAQSRTKREPTDAEGQMVREALMDEIRARSIERIPRGDPRRADRGDPKKREGDLTRIGE